MKLKVDKYKTYLKTQYENKSYFQLFALTITLSKFTKQFDYSIV